MFKNFKKKFAPGDKKNVFVNFFSLTVLQGSNYILSLATIPYLVRVLGPARFGTIAFAQAFIQYFIMITDYGFNFSATHEISLNRDDSKKVSEIFCSVMIGKVVLCIISFMALCSIIFLIPKFKSDYLIYLITFGVVLGNLLFPIWLFMGFEKMKYITIMTVIARLFITICIFIFIKKESDYLMVPLFSSLGFMTSGFLGVFVGVKTCKISLMLPSFKSIFMSMKTGFNFFLSVVSTNFYTTTNVFLLGICSSPEMTGYYAAADKLIKNLVLLNVPLANALYPYMTRSHDKKFYKKIFFMWSIAGLLLFMLLFVFSNQITNIIFGPKYHVTSIIIKIFSFQFPVVFASIILGLPFLAALGFQKYYNSSIIIGSLIHISLLIILIPFLNIYMVSIISVITEIIVLSIRVFAIRKHKLWQL